MKVLVTGGAGFIGSHLCERLAKEHKVICIDNFITGKKENLEGIDVELIEQDIMEPIELEVDRIFNLASPASPKDYMKYPIETLGVNSAGLKNILDLAVDNKAKVLQASTSEVYGDPEVHPQTEDYWGNVNPVGPRSCYDEGKRFGEALCNVYSNEFGLEVAIARIFNTYGPRMNLDDGRVVPNFITQALRGKRMTVYGDGKQTRSFCYVGDMVEGLVSLAFSEYSEVFNIGNPQEFTIIDFAEETRKACGTDSEIKFEELPEDDPKRRKPDIGKIKEKIGWEPKVPLEQGLKETVEWFRSRVQ